MCVQAFRSPSLVPGPYSLDASGQTSPPTTSKSLGGWGGERRREKRKKALPQLRAFTVNEKRNQDTKKI
jgi:hypothetical protein